MRIYKVAGFNESTGQMTTKWSSNKDDAASDRQEMRSEGVKNKDIRTHAIDFKPTKAGFLDMLNDYAN